MLKFCRCKFCCLLTPFEGSLQGHLIPCFKVNGYTCSGSIGCCSCENIKDKPLDFPNSTDFCPGCSVHLELISVNFLQHLSSLVILICTLLSFVYEVVLNIRLDAKLAHIEKCPNHCQAAAIWTESPKSKVIHLTY